MTNFIRGYRYPLAGFSLLARPGVRLYVIIPLLINTGLFITAIVMAGGQVNNLIDALTDKVAWLGWLLWLLWPLFAILVLIILFLAFSITANLIAAPFNGMLSDAVAASLGATTDDQTTLWALPAEIVQAVLSEARKLGYFLIWALPLLLLSFIPFLQAVAPFLWLVFGAWMLSLEYLEYPLGNRGKSFPEVRDIAAEHRMLMLGFGSSVLLLTLIPGINFIVMPAAVAAATRLTQENLPDV